MVNLPSKHTIVWQRVRLPTGSHPFGPLGLPGRTDACTDQADYPTPNPIQELIMDIVNLSDVIPFITRDGSEIRELLAHRNSCIRQQSLAEARLAPGGATIPHYHPVTEEIYYILEGTGRMRISETWRDVGPGDAIAIPPGSPHQICNTGDQTLHLLCCCAPGYEHDDTVLLETNE